MECHSLQKNLRLVDLLNAKTVIAPLECMEILFQVRCLPSFSCVWVSLWRITEFVCQDNDAINNAELISVIVISTPKILNCSLKFCVAFLTCSLYFVSALRGRTDHTPFKG